MDIWMNQFVYSLPESPDDADYHYAQRIFVRVYHESRRRVVDVNLCNDERIELYVPRKFTGDDAREFMEINVFEFVEARKARFDMEHKNNPEPINYDSKLPFLGQYLPIRILAESDDGGRERQEQYGQNPSLLSLPRRQKVQDVCEKAGCEGVC